MRITIAIRVGNRQTDRRTDRQMDRQTDRRPNSHLHLQLAVCMGSENSHREVSVSDTHELTGGKSLARCGSQLWQQVTQVTEQCFTHFIAVVDMTDLDHLIHG